MLKHFRMDDDLNKELGIASKVTGENESEFIRKAILTRIDMTDIIEELIAELVKKYKMDTEDILRLKRAIKKMVK